MYERGKGNKNANKQGAVEDKENPALAGGDLDNPDVTTKYRAGGDIVNLALKAVVEIAVVGAKIVDLCILGDKVIEDECAKIFTKKVKDASGEMKNVAKGISFPTCVSLNNICGHFSPTVSDKVEPLKKGDVIKIDLGAHFDGFLSQGAHSMIIGYDAGEKVMGRAADVIKAAWTAGEAAARAMQVGASNKSISIAINKAAKTYNCTPLHGVLSHQVKRNCVDGTKVILNHETVGEEQVEACNIGLNEVYCMDLVISTGDGKARESDARTTVFKRAKATNFQLKTQKARQFISEITQKCPEMPFSLRMFEDEQLGRIGASEAKRHDLLHDFPVFQEKEGEIVAQFKYTLLILPTGPKKITGLPFTQEPMMASSYQVEDPDLKAILSVSMNPKTKKKQDSAKAKQKSECASQGSASPKSKKSDTMEEKPKPKSKSKGDGKGRRNSKGGQKDDGAQHRPKSDSHNKPQGNIKQPDRA